MGPPTKSYPRYAAAIARTSFDLTLNLTPIRSEHCHRLRNFPHQRPKGQIAGRRKLAARRLSFPFAAPGLTGSTPAAVVRTLRENRTGANDIDVRFAAGSAARPRSPIEQPGDYRIVDPARSG